jgi:hypothetical protein
MSFATGSLNCGDRSLRYSRPNTGLQPTAAHAIMGPLRLKPPRWAGVPQPCGPVAESARIEAIARQPLLCAFRPI